MSEAVSVDALCGFGAKNFNHCTEFIQLGVLQVWTDSCISVISAFSVEMPVLYWCVSAGNVLSKGALDRLNIFAQPLVVVRREAGDIRRYAAIQSLGARSLGMGAKLKDDDLAGVRAVFALDPRLQQDTLPIGDFPLSRLLLSDDSNYPWFILVPRREGISEIFQLDVADQQQLWKETTALAEMLNVSFGADKMNVGALGNVVSQLHMHVIVRKRDDAAWPTPVWGKHPAKPYSDEQVAAIRERLRLVLIDDFTFVEG